MQISNKNKSQKISELDNVKLKKINTDNILILLSIYDKNTHSYVNASTNINDLITYNLNSTYSYVSNRFNNLWEYYDGEDEISYSYLSKKEIHNLLSSYDPMNTNW